MEQKIENQPEWLISVREDPSRLGILRTPNFQALAAVFPFEFPPLKVGTLDSLMQLGDDLTRMDPSLEGILKRICQALSDIFPVGQLNLESPAEAVHNFRWNTAKYSPSDELRVIATHIMEECQKIDEDLKVHLNQYTSLKASIAAIDRKSEGSLLARALDPYIKKQHIIGGGEDSSLLSVFVVVPVDKLPQWEAQYEVLEDLSRINDMNKQLEAKMAVMERGDFPPEKRAGLEAEIQLLQSSIDMIRSQGLRPEIIKEQDGKQRVQLHRLKLHQDNEHALYRVVIFKQGLEAYRAACREQGYTIRPFTFQEQAVESQRKEKSELVVNLDTEKNRLSNWSRAVYGEVLNDWLHLKAIRLWVEAILRYGLPAKFVSFVIRPQDKHEKTIRRQLAQMFGHLSLTGGAEGAAGGEQQEGDVDSQLAGLGLSASDQYPYVSFTLNLDFFPPPPQLSAAR